MSTKQGSLTHLYALLRPLRLYSLGRGGLIDAELTAYGAALEMLERAVGELQSAPHPQSASEQALGLHEAAVGLPVRVGVDKAHRRELILRRLGGPYPPTWAGTRDALAACGLINPQIRQQAGALFVRAQSTAPGISFAQAWQLALRAMPAHLPVFIGGHSWDELDGRQRSWDARDALGHSWDEIELVG